LVFWAFVVFLIIGGLLGHDAGMLRSGLLILAGFLLLTIILIFGIDIKKLINKWKMRNSKCIHGIKGGETFNACIKCRELKEEQEHQHQVKLNEQRIKEEIRQKANLLFEQEKKRLTEVQLHTENYIMALSPRDFENVVAELFKRLGYSVTQTPYTNDRGKDAILKKDNMTYLVECKHYGKNKPVGRPALQKFYGAMTEEHAEKGFYVSTGGFTNTAIDYAKHFKIELINLGQLVLLNDKVFNNNKQDYVKVMCLECGDIVKFSSTIKEDKKNCIKGHIVENNFKGVYLSPNTIISGKVFCDKCGKEMQLIKRYWGQFWRCSGYPSCTFRRRYMKE